MILCSCGCECGRKKPCFTAVKRILGYSLPTGLAGPGWLENRRFIEIFDLGLAFKQAAIYWGGGEQLFVS